ncbi:hypothetical protein AVEN_135674-1 [Araneus ventricosus]|uniref:Uncharacterized protein n=1 Tax=Araneus ventricosus TaxID=182803 RepID=A0A4Y2L250_ARAVE|nr:hypothetical protein AVEN_135674-1 [Araneus ventricosus]
MWNNVELGERCQETEDQRNRRLAVMGLAIPSREEPEEQKNSNAFGQHFVSIIYNKEINRCSMRLDTMKRERCRKSVINGWRRYEIEGVAKPFRNIDPYSEFLLAEEERNHGYFRLALCTEIDMLLDKEFASISISK